MARIVLEIDIPDNQLEDALAHVKRNLPRDAEVVHECTYDRFYDGSIIENWRESARALREINSVLGIRQKRTVGVRLRLRDLSKRSDWFTVK